MFDQEELKTFYQKKEVASHFLQDRFSSPYGKVLHQRQFSFIEKQIKTFKPKRVLDLACGPGRSLPTLSKVPRAVYYDGSWEMLKQLHPLVLDKENISLLHGDGFELPFKESFDLVVSMRFIRHFKYEQRQKIYQAVKNSLKPGGVFVFDAVNFVVSQPVREIDGGENSDIYDKLYKWWELELEIKENGLKLIDSQGIYYQYLKARYLDRGFKKFKLNALGYGFLSWLERQENGEPLEWMVACQK